MEGARGMFATLGLTVGGLIDWRVEFRVKLDSNLLGMAWHVSTVSGPASRKVLDAAKLSSKFIRLLVRCLDQGASRLSDQNEKF